MPPSSDARTCAAAPGSGIVAGWATSASPLPPGPKPDSPATVALPIRSVVAVSKVSTRSPLAAAKAEPSGSANSWLIGPVPVANGVGWIVGPPGAPASGAVDVPSRSESSSVVVSIDTIVPSDVPTYSVWLAVSTVTATASAAAIVATSPRLTRS